MMMSSLSSSNGSAKALLFLLLAAGIVAVRGDENATTAEDALAAVLEDQEPTKCIFCDTMDTFDADLEFAGVECNRWNLVAAFAPPGEQCHVLRAAAVQFCGCPTEVEETCKLCPHGTEGFEADQNLLFLKDMTCGDIVDMPAVDGPSTCTFIEEFSYVCGCPGVVPSCSLCGQDGDGNQLVMERPDEVLIPGSKEDPDVTCNEWDKLLSLQKEDEEPEDDTATSRGGGTRCEQALTLSQERTGVQLQGLCGCPGVEPVRECSACPEGLHLHTKDNEECGKVGFLAAYLTNMTQCEILQEGAASIDCCKNEPEPIDLSETTDAQTPVSATASGATTRQVVFGVATIVLAAFGFVL